MVGPHLPRKRGAKPQDVQNASFFMPFGVSIAIPRGLSYRQGLAMQANFAGSSDWQNRKTMIIEGRNLRMRRLERRLWTE